jgi:hypothetical protein
MTESSPLPNLAARWSSARQLYPIYSQLAREFVIDAQPCGDLEAGVDTPGAEAVEQAWQWLDLMDERVQVHQLRQFLQTSPLIDQDALLNLLQHFLAKTNHTHSVRDKIDFLLVQYFGQVAPSRLGDDDVDLAFVAQSLEPALGQIELKPPVWLKALDRVLEAAHRCRSLDELLHGGVLEQGRKVKTQAGDLFYLPVALAAFTRFGYLMRRVFFHLMHGDLNVVLDGLGELEEKGIATIDCRRAQFSAQEPISRLRMICQSWKVMFQAEYSSGQPLRMLVDLRAAVEDALGRGRKPSSNNNKPVAKAAPAKPAPAKARPAASAAAAAAIPAPLGKHAPAKPALTPKPQSKVAASQTESPEFEVSSAPEWDPDAASTPGAKK